MMCEFIQDLMHLLSIIKNINFHVTKRLEYLYTYGIATDYSLIFSHKCHKSDLKTILKEIKNSYIWLLSTIFYTYNLRDNGFISASSKCFQKMRCKF